MSVEKLLELDRNTWNHTIGCRFLVFDRNAWNYIIGCKSKESKVGNQKAPFLIASTLRCRGGCDSFP